MQFSRRTGSYPMLDKFIQETGIQTTYLEDINDNSEFFNVIQPDLALGNYTGYDLITPSDWMIARLIRLGYVQPLDYRLLPNFQANANPIFLNPWYDPGNVYSVPWQAGIVGIGYNRALTGRDITSFEDLFDPAFAGNVGLFSEMIDTMCMTILSMGKECTDATIEDAAAARDKLQAADATQDFTFYGNDYYGALAQGNVALTMAWSGDVTQMKLYDNPDVEFVIPDTGGMLFVDNMIIPNQSQAYADAHMLMDFWYNLDNAVAQTEWVGYYSPVTGVADRVLADAQAARDAGDEETAGQLDEVARTAIPTEEQLAQTHQYKILTEQEETTWNNLFNEVVFN
jgi:spermidine/putrescine transport system substrate-binding protein